MAQNLTLSRRRVVSALVGLGAGAASSRLGFAQAGKTQRVNLAVATSTLTPGYPELYVPANAGFWAKDNIDVNVILTQGTSQVVQLVTAGNADIGLINPEGVVVGRLKQHLQLKSIGAIGTISSYKLGVKSSSSIKSVADFKGKRIGLFSMASGGTYYLISKLKEFGLDAKDVTMIPVGFGATAADALQNDRIDVLVLWLAAFAGLENAGLDLRYLPISDWEKNRYSWIFSATEKTIKEKDEVLKHVLRGVAESLEFTAAQPKAAVAVFWKRYPDAINAKLPPAKAFENDVRLITSKLEQSGIGQPNLPAPPHRIWLEQTKEQWDGLQKDMQNTGLIESTGDAASVFTNKFTAFANDFNHEGVANQARKFPLPV